MSTKFPEYKNFDLPQINKTILEFWEKDETFKRSLTSRENNPEFIFFEGPPSANGKPGIHHVIARTIKDIFCRYKTNKGFKVDRKAGWDTHGLPVELSVETELGITKEDIGKSVSIAEYNGHCRKNVMKFTKEWEELTQKMGYWVNMDDPYITYDNRYIETLWYLLSEIHKKGYLYKGYTIQPYSPAAGTGLSTHELNQPGCYRDVKDTTCVAQFKVIKDDDSQFIYEDVTSEDVHFLAWTTTPWTLPSNTALAVGNNITYVKVKTINQYTGTPVTVILAEDLLSAHFNPKNKDLSFDDYKLGDKKIPFSIISTYKGKDLTGIHYEQLIDWVRPQGKAFEVIPGDFVTTEDGTGIVHIAPTFGADDYIVANENGITALLVTDSNGNSSPLVDKRGRFIRFKDLDNDFISKAVNKETYADFEGRYVKNEYDDSLPENAPTADVDIAVMLKKANKAFKVEKHVHNYPHCWRTDKPVLYYPLDSWFIKTTAIKDRLLELNETINWKPQSTGTGRFGKWLENLVDWNLSRSRFWGTPLPVWTTEDKSEHKCIGSVAELKKELQKSVEAGFMDENPLSGFTEGDTSAENYENFDLHRPFVDNIILVSSDGKKMFREPDLIDVWFDSGAMPYAQLHYPFRTNDEEFRKKFPADFIAEGVDQTRGWFFTLHTIATMLFDSVSFKNIISNGLVLDKKGNKMSKRLGNAVDPFETINKYGADPLRWYMMTNAQPWDNLKFDISGVEEVRRKFFGTLYNTYSFFSLYANVDNFTYSEEKIPVNKRPKSDRWIISQLNTLIIDVENAYEDYEPTRAGRAIQEFVIENLSNWYVRLNRKRFWGGEYNKNKIAAYQTLYECLITIAQLAAPIAPFYMEKIYRDLALTSDPKTINSVHLAEFSKANADFIDKDLELQMGLAQKISSMVLSLRRKESIKVRQPLAKIIIPVLDQSVIEPIKEVQDIILSEVNIKEINFISDTSGILVKKIKPNFKLLGPKFGKSMKAVASKLTSLQQDDIMKFEQEGNFTFSDNGQDFTIDISDVEIMSEDIPGWTVAVEGKLTVALDVNITDELRNEGIARELINRIQNLRKDSELEVTDKIVLEIGAHDKLDTAITDYKEYISGQTLAKEIILVESLKNDDRNAKSIDLDENISTTLRIKKVTE